MSLSTKIATMCCNEQSRNPKRISDRINLYAQGTKAKLKNAEYALSKIHELSTRSDAFTDSTEPGFSNLEKLQFHVDAFFAFLYSAFDIVSHIVNAKHRLTLDEHRVSFDKVEEVLSSSRQGTSLQVTYSRIATKLFFKNLDKYRNCSTHRRQICIESTQKTTTAGYNTSGTITRVQHLLCDNPLSLSPKFAQEREVVSYCSKVLSLGILEIEKIIDIL